MEPKVRATKIESFEDLEVYKKLCQLHLQINRISLSFPKHELYELGSQIRRSSNSVAANLAEGWNNKHINIYLEGINKALGEIQETRHHWNMAFQKGYVTKEIFQSMLNQYDECGRMLRRLEQSLEKWKENHK